MERLKDTLLVVLGFTLLWFATAQAKYFDTLFIASTRILPDEYGSQCWLSLA